MAKVTVSSNITDDECIKKTRRYAADWAARLTRDGAKGRFEVSHGKDLPCAAAHDRAVDKGFWIHAVGANCEVFVTRAGNSRWFAGAQRHKEAIAYQPGKCSCKGGH